MKIVVRLIIAMAIIGILLIIFGLLGVINSLGPIFIGPVLLTVIILYSFHSLGRIEIEEVGVLLFLGRGIKNLKKGIYLAPLWLFKVRKYPGIEIQDELPGPPEKIYHGEGSIPDGMFFPIRIKFGSPRNNDPNDLKNDPYNHSMVIEVNLIIKWRIIDSMIFSEKMGTIENCYKILALKAREVMGDDFSQMTPARALKNLGRTGQRMENELKGKTSDSGIEILDAYVKPFEFSKLLNEAVIKVSENRQNALSTVIDAEASRKKRMEEGKGESSFILETLSAKAEGEALVKKLLLEAEALGIERLVDLAGKSPRGEMVILIKALEEAYKNANFSIIPSGELFSATSGIKEMLNKIKEEI